jgi:hypothetical protein
MVEGQKISWVGQAISKNAIILGWGGGSMLNTDLIFGFN